MRKIDPKTGLIQVTCSINDGEYGKVYHIEDGESLHFAAEWIMEAVFHQLDKVLDDNEKMYLSQDEWDKMLDILEVCEVK